jgi:hypothetical protein
MDDSFRVRHPRFPTLCQEAFDEEIAALYSRTRPAGRVENVPKPQQCRPWTRTIAIENTFFLHLATT